MEVEYQFQYIGIHAMISHSTKAKDGARILR